jgi:hypothetical protein
MAILVETDRSEYFPQVSQVGSALQGLLARAQVYCESEHGANRPLELQLHEQVVNVRSFSRVELPFFPVVLILAVDRLYWENR